MCIYLNKITRIDRFILFCQYFIRNKRNKNACPLQIFVTNNKCKYSFSISACMYISSASITTRTRQVARTECMSWLPGFSRFCFTVRITTATWTWRASGRVSYLPASRASTKSRTRRPSNPGPQQEGPRGLPLLSRNKS